MIPGLYISTTGHSTRTYSPLIDNVVGIKEAVHRVRGFGDRNGVRLPLLNTITDEQWEAFSDIVNTMIEMEDSL